MTERPDFPLEAEPADVAEQARAASAAEEGDVDVEAVVDSPEPGSDLPLDAPEADVTEQRREAYSGDDDEAYE